MYDCLSIPAMWGHDTVDIDYGAYYWCSHTNILTKNLTILSDQTTDNDLITTTIENSINCNDILTGQTTDTYILTIKIDNSVISITY